MIATRQREEQETGQGDEGFMLLAVIVLVFLMLLTLTVAAPRIAASLKRDKEVESKHRADQYVRAIRVYYRKFGHYPSSVEQLEKSNNQRFLRAKYLDPLTGKDDWRLIHVGENKTKVKGFFGEDLPGIGGTGLGSGIGTPATTGPGTAPPAFGSPANPANPSTGNGTTGDSGVKSTDATSFTGGSGGPIMGIGSSKSGDAILVVDEQTSYQEWEFLYDPRIEQLYAKGNLLGGVNSGTGGTGLSGASPIGGTPTPTPVTPPATPQ